MIILFIIIAIIIYIHIQNYKKSSYYKVTNNSILELYMNKGKLGEYLTYKNLIKYEERGAKFLFNLYVPKDNNQTTELDLIMITQKGILVFESKNYSGWIFGDEKSRMWMQTLPNGKGRSYKTQFLNPIMQNNGHINNLKKLLNEDIPIFSIIVFSERCTLKKVPINTNELKIINRSNVIYAVEKIYDSNPNLIDEEKVIDLYNKLYKHTQTSESIKQQHIENIKKKYL